MKCFLFALPSILLLAGCAVSDQEAKVPHKNARTVLSQSTVPVSYDSNGKPFLQVNGERIGIDFDANPHDENPTEFLVTQWKDKNGRVLVDIDNVTVAAADEGG